MDRTLALDCQFPRGSGWWRDRRPVTHTAPPPVRQALVLLFQFSLPGSPGAGIVYLSHRRLPVAASSPAIQSRTPWSPLAAPTMILSLMASGAAVKVTSGVSENEVSQTTLPVSLSVAMMRGELPKPPAPVMTRFPDKAAPRERIWRSCLGSMRQTMRPRSPERASIL